MQGKLDFQQAVELGVLVPIRCIRVKTNVDLSTVRINGVKYYAQDLESKLFVPERNNILAETYLKFVRGKKTVVSAPPFNMPIKYLSCLNRRELSVRQYRVP